MCCSVRNEGVYSTRKARSMKADSDIHKVHHKRMLDYDIGNTPLQPVVFTIQGKERRVYLKLEGCNPTYSMKDRKAYSLIRALDDQGRCSAQSTIVESTSGNL